MPNTQLQPKGRIAPLKFKDPLFTAKGEVRAVVTLTNLRTLWFNTGSLCNITCQDCYMDSSPTNDRLAYLKLSDVEKYLAEIKKENLSVEEIAFTGGEPFMNKDLIEMMESALQKKFRVLVLTNAMKPFHNKRNQLVKLLKLYPNKLRLRVSIDHFTKILHEVVRGDGSWQPMIKGIKWLADNKANITVAGRTCWNETEATTRRGYSDLFAAERIQINANDPGELILFPEMNTSIDVPEITTQCWDLLNVAPENMMCATSRMIVKHRGADHTEIMPCTLLPYDPAFKLGRRLVNAKKTVQLNHPHCAQFCVLGGASCNPDHES